jgi:hypothetical protein
MSSHRPFCGGREAYPRVLVVSQCGWPGTWPYSQVPVGEPLFFGAVSPWVNSCFSARTPRRTHGFGPRAHHRPPSHGDLASSMPSRRALCHFKWSVAFTRSASLTLRDESVRRRTGDLACPRAPVGELLSFFTDALPNCSFCLGHMGSGGSSRICLGHMGLWGDALGEPIFQPRRLGELMVLPQNHTLGYHHIAKFWFPWANSCFSARTLGRTQVFAPKSHHTLGCHHLVT